MAIRAVTIASFAGDSCRCEMDYNDATLAISKTRIINNSTRTCVLTVRHRTLLTTLSITVGPGVTQQRNIAGMSFTTDADGLSLGQLEVLCSWQ